VQEAWVAALKPRQLAAATAAPAAAGTTGSASGGTADIPRVAALQQLGHGVARRG
jgi:hypothetical protein